MIIRMLIAITLARIILTLHFYHPIRSFCETDGSIAQELLYQNILKTNRYPSSCLSCLLINWFYVKIPFLPHFPYVLDIF